MFPIYFIDRESIDKFCSLVWLIYVSIKDLGIKTSIVSDFVFARNTVLSYVFFFLLKIDLSLLIPAVIAQIVTPTAELAIPTEIHPLTVYMEIKKYST